ncbi:hypothetical protein ACFVAD_18900 [Sutcliffiella sp. NPDC057660]|uniref:hypothetical protein n=1 Tax=Sutcliffiella sp. NPDC057660 TaxID=3346199 RepID=UPI00368F2AF6
MKFTVSIDSEKLRNLTDFVQVVQVDNGRTSEYEMSLDNFLKIVAKSSEAGQESPWLPRNCIKYVSRGFGYEVYLDIPKQQWEIEYANTKLKVGFPRLVFQYSLRSCTSDKKSFYQVELKKIFAVKGNKKIRENTMLYKFPYSNVYDDGSVCMGTNAFPNITCISDLESLHSLFIHSPFTGDYGAKTTLKKKLWELFTEIFNEKDFDDNVLIPMDKTLGMLLGLETIKNSEEN